MHASVIRGKEVPVTQTDWGSLKWLVSDQNVPETAMTFGYVTFKPGESNPTHLHPNCEEILFVVSGVLEHTLPQGGTARLHSGDCIVLPAGEEHAATNVGSEDAVVVVVFDSPERKTEAVDADDELA